MSVALSVAPISSSTLSALTDPRIDIATRLRRAIYLNDLVLVRRIVKNHPQSTQNPDWEDRSNTSLHLAAKLGFLEIAEFLIDAGHEDQGVSRNADYESPLMLALQNESDAVAVLLATSFPQCIPWKNSHGADSLMTACRRGNPHLITTLISLSPSPNTLLSATDFNGDTALHYASAYGHLKGILTLVQAGANPVARNAHSWTPIQYSSTVQAEVYFRNLVQEFERRKAEGERMEREMRKRGEAGLRIVTGEESSEGERGIQSSAANRGDGWSAAGGRTRARSGD